MTQRLYEGDAYVKEFQAAVTACIPLEDGFEIILERTAFYPEGGGQPGDRGWLDDAAVLDTYERDGQIRHLTAASLEKGRIVTGRLDWDYRFSNMQHHTGEHILSGIIRSTYGLDNVGFHMGQDAVTIDINGRLDDLQLEAAEVKVNRLIQQNLPVAVSYPEGETLSRLDYRSKKALSGKVRIITIKDGDTCACCGTHVARTGEIGILKVTAAIHYKGGMRITMLCGLRALSDYSRKHKSIAAISAALSVKQDEVLTGVTRLKQEGVSRDGQIGRLYQRLLQMMAASYRQEQERIFLLEEDLSGIQLRNFAEGLKEKGRLVLVLSGSDADGYRYALGSRSIDVRSFSKELNLALNGRGGGSQGLVQGTLYAPAETIREYFWKHPFKGESE